MALSNAEKGRRFRARELEKKKAVSAPGSLSGILRKPFFEWADETGALSAGSNYGVGLDQCGLSAPVFTDDSGPKSYTGDIETLHEPFPDSPFVAPSNSLARAEVMVGSLIDAAKDVAQAVNDYKQSEIKARIAEIEQSDLSDAETKRKALADIVRLQKMLDQLSKQVRWTFPQWKVTGE